MFLFIESKNRFLLYFTLVQMPVVLMQSLCCNLGIGKGRKCLAGANLEGRKGNQEEKLFMVRTCQCLFFPQHKLSTYAKASY